MLIEAIYDTIFENWRPIMKRLLNCSASEKLAMNGEEWKASIKACEGRVIMSENVIAVTPLWDDISNPELSAAFGSDLCLLNLFDVLHPHIAGIKDEGNPVATLKKMIGRPVGCNLEPIDEEAMMMETRLDIPKGRRAIPAAFVKAEALGLSFIALTGNPRSGVTNKAILKAIKEAKQLFGGLIIAGKMHSAGVDEPLVSLSAISDFIDAGGKHGPWFIWKRSPRGLWSDPPERGFSDDDHWHFAGRRRQSDYSWNWSDQ